METTILRNLSAGKYEEHKSIRLDPEATNREPWTLNREPDNLSSYEIYLVVLVAFFSSIEINSISKIRVASGPILAPLPRLP